MATDVATTVFPGREQPRTNVQSPIASAALAALLRLRIWLMWEALMVVAGK
jgi:hypothetical protein